MQQHRRPRLSGDLYGHGLLLVHAGSARQDLDRLRHLAVSGSTVTLTIGANRLPYQYCVSGNTVTFSVQAGSSVGGHR